MNPQTRHRLLHRIEEQEAEVKLQREAAALRRQQAAEAERGELLQGIAEREARARLQQEAGAALRRQQAAEAERVRAAVEAEQRRTLLKISQFIWLSFGVLEGLIGLRILLKLIAANPNNPFAQLIYDVTDLFLWPFAGLTMTPAANGIVLEVSSIIALFFYALVSVLIQRLIWIAFSRPRV